MFRQKYKTFHYNKNHSTMRGLFITPDIGAVIVSKYSSSKLFTYILSHLKTTRGSYKMSQQITLNYKDGLMSKAKFYEAIKILTDLDIITKTSKHNYFVNYYYINVMTTMQWKEFVSDMRLLDQQEQATRSLSRMNHEPANAELLVKADKLRVFKK